MPSSARRRLLVRSAGFGLLLAAALAFLALALPFPAINLLDLAYSPTWWWIAPLVVLAVLAATAAHALLRQWQSRRFLHDAIAAILLPALLAAVTSGLMIQSAAAHERVMLLAMPDLSVDTIVSLERGYLQGRLDEAQYVEGCRYYRRWLYVEEGREHVCHFPGDVPLAVPDQVDLEEFSRRFSNITASLEGQARALRWLAVMPWLAMLAGLLAALLRRRQQ